MKMLSGKWILFLSLVSALVPASRSLGAVDMFLKLTDGQGQVLIEGESVDQQHPKEILISSFSHGVSVPISTSGSGGGTVGKASFSDLSLSKMLDKASPLLYSYAAQGKRIPTAVLTLRKPAAKPLEFYRITLTDVFISSVQTSGGGDVPSESLSLSFSKIEWFYVPLKPDGTAGAAVVTTWNLAANTP